MYSVIVYFTHIKTVSSVYMRRSINDAFAEVANNNAACKDYNYTTQFWRVLEEKDVTTFKDFTTFDR